MIIRGLSDRTIVRTVLSLTVMLTSSVLTDSMLMCKGRSSGSVYPVWHNPCGMRSRLMTRKKYHSLDNEVSHDGLRNPSSRPLRRVRMQLRIAYEHFRSGHIQRDIDTVYYDVKEQNKTQFKFEYKWLPIHQFTWYKRDVKCLSNKSKVEVLLPRFHLQLQNFSATFEYLILYGGESQLSEHQETFGTRRHLLAETSHQVKKLLCEVETAILNVGLQLPDRLSEQAAKAMIWDSKPDHTMMLIQDWGVLAIYKSFLDDWTSIICRLVGNKRNVPCKPIYRHRHRSFKKRHRLKL